MDKKEIKNAAELFWHRHKQTFKGINAGDYIDKDDFDKFVETLSSTPPVEEMPLFRCRDEDNGKGRCGIRCKECQAFY